MEGLFIGGWRYAYPPYYSSFIGRTSVSPPDSIATDGLTQIPDLHMVHIIEHLILAYHSPNKGIGASANARVN